MITILIHVLLPYKLLYFSTLMTRPNIWISLSLNHFLTNIRRNMDDKELLIFTDTTKPTPGPNGKMAFFFLSNSEFFYTIQIYNNTSQLLQMKSRNNFSWYNFTEQCVVKIFDVAQWLTYHVSLCSGGGGGQGGQFLGVSFFHHH